MGSKSASFDDKWVYATRQPDAPRPGPAVAIELNLGA